MKIAIISKLHSPVSSSGVGGIEVLNYNLSSELSKRDHDVYLFASGDSKTEAKLYPICEKALFADGGAGIDPQSMRKIIYRENKAFIDAIEMIEKNNFDIIHHSHSEFLPVYLAYKKKIPQVFTAHITDNTNTTLYSDITTTLDGHLPMVSISMAQQKILNNISFIKNIYNGISLSDFSLNQEPQEYFAWLGRIVPNKGTREAIKIADLADVKLKFAGGYGVGEVADIYRKEIEKIINDSAEYLGEIGNTARSDLLSNAKATLLPIQWEEPFGLVTIESLASGTPVIAFARGAVPEIIEDGKTGFIVNYSEEDKRGNWIVKKSGIEGMVEAVKLLNGLSQEEAREMRRNARNSVEQRFTVERMVDDYEAIYKQILKD